jgi:hypothetical protein
VISSKENTSIWEIFPLLKGIRGDRNGIFIHGNHGNKKEDIK